MDLFRIRLDAYISYQYLLEDKANIDFTFTGHKLSPVQ